jgi:hypothetical protein
MAFARIATFPGGTKEQYDYLGQLMGEGVANQPERRLLASGPTNDGWTIIQIWDSQAALEQFIVEHLRPAMERAGDRGYPEPPLITDIELADLYL